MTAKVPLKVHLRLRFQNLGKPRTAGLCGRAADACDCGPLSVLKSNGLHRSENLPVKFGFSPKTVSANAAQKLPLQRCFKPFLIPLFNFTHKRPKLAFKDESEYTHSPSPTGSHTAAHTAKQGPSLPRPQCGFVPPAKYLIFRHAFIYIHFPVLCEPSTPAEEKNLAKLLP